MNFQKNLNFILTLFDKFFETGKFEENSDSRCHWNQECHYVGADMLSTVRIIAKKNKGKVLSNGF